MPHRPWPPYIHDVLAVTVPDADYSVGCVLRVDHGVYDLWCRSGRCRVTLGGAMLARMAEDPDAAPCPGDWCLVRAWPDGPLTLESVLTVRRPR